MTGYGVVELRFKSLGGLSIKSIGSGYHVSVATLVGRGGTMKGHGATQTKAARWRSRTMQNASKTDREWARLSEFTREKLRTTSASGGADAGKRAPRGPRRIACGLVL